MKKIFITFLILSTVFCPVFAQVQVDKGNFPLGQFNQMQEGPLSAPWQAVKDGKADVIVEDGKKFLRLHNIEPKYNEMLLKIKVPADWEAVKISANTRSKDVVPGSEVWHTAKIQTVFYSPKNEKLTDGWPMLGGVKSDQWEISSVTIPVPSKDATLFLQVALYNCTGIYDIEWIKIEPSIFLGFNRNADGKPDCWNKEPVEELTPKRGRIVLNGPWRFAPFAPEKQNFTIEEWGLISVPGNWRKSGPGNLLMRGKGELWNSFKPDDLSIAWYQRDILIPKNWSGRKVILEISRLSTDAIVYLNGKECGKIQFPFGEVDLTGAVAFGRINDLRILVNASLETLEEWSLMGIEAGQVYKTEAKLSTRGIIGEVFLNSYPVGAHISDLFIQTSVKNNQITVEFEIANNKKNSLANCEVNIFDQSKKLAKSFKSKIQLSASELQTVQIRETWQNPKLWDFKQPNLYTLHLKIESDSISDEYSQRFGFREFWIEGKKFYLNGREFRLRPNLIPDQYAGNIGNFNYIEGAIKGMIDAGFNFGELWPWDHEKRGEQHFRQMWADAADRLGFPISGVALSANKYIVDFSTWACVWNEGRKEEWTKRMTRELRKYRNHPSIIMWGTSANFFGQHQDQNPLYIGMRDWYEKKDKEKAGLEVIDIIKKFDPTRPVFTHHGADIGDVHTCNNYLNMIPLQEREEWLSHWAEHGQMPYLAVEFGTPLYVSFHRGRSGYGNATKTEPLYTEWCAVYFGEEAYRMETKDYKDFIAKKFKNDQEYGNLHCDRALMELPLHQKIQELFIRNTWRSWRTWGLTGGMIPWENMQRWLTDSTEEVELGKFTPGMRGAYLPYIKKTNLKLYDPSYGWKVLPSGKILTENNSDTLAWIAGAPLFTDKTHNFYSNQEIHKNIVLINDSNIILPYEFEWKAFLENAKIADRKESGTIKIAENLFIPITFSCSAQQKSRGKIILEAKIGEKIHKDEFNFTVFPQATQATASEIEFSIIDPVGETSAMLKNLGFKLKEYSQGSDSKFLIVGRKAMSPENKLKLSLDEFVKNGGKLLIFAQTPEYLQRYYGFRTARHLARRVFPISANHPVCKGLQAEDLSDWAGESKLVDPYPKVTKLNQQSLYGWRWGSRGVVASCSIEKPHLSAWTPILQCEFDLAYTPLMEYNNNGFAIFCGLDLEDHYDKDPAAMLLLKNLLDYFVSKNPPAKIAKTYCFGDEKDFSFLNLLGVTYQKTTTIPKENNILFIVGSKKQISDEKLLKEFISNGGRVFFLPRTDQQALLDVKLKKENYFYGANSLAESELTYGLSLSDLRARGPYRAYLVQDGAEIFADGMIGIKKIDKGLAVFCQINPDWLIADEKTYLRYTRWRHTRAISQLLTNLGANFVADSLNPKRNTIIELTGEWKAKLVTPLPPSPADNKPKNIFSTNAKTAIFEKNFSNWQSVQVPGDWEKYGGEWETADGEAVFKKIVEIPEDWKGLDLELSLGTLDDFDDTFWNGRQIGGFDTSSAWNIKRVYTIPSEMVKPGKNEIAIRIFDHYGGGGFTGYPDDIFIRAIVKEQAPLYHRDFRKDFDLGDEPYRYYRW